MKNIPAKLSSSLFAVIFTFELSAYGHSSHAGSCDHMVLQKMNCEK